MKRILIYSLILVAFVSTLTACKKSNSSSSSQKKESFAPAIRTNIIATIEEEGEIAPYKSVEVKASMSGRITRIFVNEGDMVRKGQIIAKVEADREQAKTINSIVNDYEDAQISYKEAKQTYDENVELFKQGFISEDELTESKNNFTLAKLKYESSKEEYELTKTEMGQLNNIGTKIVSVVSPIAGIITTKAVEEGELVSGETSTRSGTSLFTVAEAVHLVVKVNINEYDIDRVQQNQEVDITRGQSKIEHYQGRVYKIAPTAETEDGVKVYPVEIEINNPSSSLRFGMSVSLTIKTAVQMNVLSIPVTALFADNDRKEYVLVKLPEGGTETRYVERGINDEFYVEIKSGLEEGDLVVNQSSAKGTSTQNNNRGMMMPPMGGMGGGKR